MVSGLFAQTPNPVQGAGSMINIAPIVKHSLESRATGTYYLDYVEYDVSFLGSTLANTYYNNLWYSKTDTAYGGIPFVAEYYDSLVYSADLATWSALSWSNVASMTVDSVFIQVGVDNTTGTTDYLKMKIVQPATVTSGSGNWLNFNVAPIWQDSVSTTVDIGAPFSIVSFASGAVVTDKFAIMFQFYGNPLDTCRLTWQYPHDGSGCANGNGSQQPLKWELYPTSFYNICLGGTGLVQNQSIGLPRITGTGGFGYYSDCNDPATPYLLDVAPNFDPAKNQFQHWNIWAIVTLTDNLGLAEQAEKGIKVFAYPNPANDFLNIDFNLLLDANNVNLTITDLGGRVVMNKVLGAFAAGKNNSNVQIDLPSGVYTYSLDFDGTRLTRKFIVNK